MKCSCARLSVSEVLTQMHTRRRSSQGHTDTYSLTFFIMAVSSLRGSSQYDLTALVYSGPATNDYFDDERINNCVLQLIG